MSKITFTRLEYKNFMAVGNIPIVIDLNQSKTTLITGQNGSGKSAVLSALCFALFGRAYTQINKPGLINSINLKHLLTTIDFEIGKKKFKIVRGMKPGIFEIYENGLLVNQDPSIRDYQKFLEQQILKFNFRAFTQVVVVGGGDNYSPFMKLSTKDRRDFIEDLLDIRVFSMMNSLVKDDYRNIESDVRDINSSLRSIKEKIVLQESFIKRLKSDRNISTDKISATILLLQEDNDGLQTILKEKIGELDACKIKVDEYRVLDDSLADTKAKIRQVKSEIDKKNEKHSRCESWDKCPSCSQEISPMHKSNISLEHESEIESLMKSMKILEVTSTGIKSLMEKLGEHHQNKYVEIQEEISNINRLMFANNNSISGANRQLSDLGKDTSSIDVESAKLKAFAKEYIAADSRKKEMIVTKEYNDFIQQILADSGIKSKIIKQYIPTINRLINKYLSDLDFFVSFHLDEFFDETIKSRHRDTFKYENFSDGQKRRIDLAILLTWVEIAKAKNALHTNILFLDEIDAPLDSTGAEMLPGVLKSISSENVFIISHKRDILIDKVDSVIEFRLHNSFTERVES